jgi:hypothetical protein
VAKTSPFPKMTRGWISPMSFAFSSPADPDRIVLIMDANTFATGSEFHPDAVYQLLVDTNNDNEPDVTFNAVFSEPQAGAQSVTLYRATGAEAGDMEPKGEVIIESSPVSFGSDVEVVEAGPFRFFAGRRSDPFFADVDGCSTISNGPVPTCSATKTSSALPWRCPTTYWVNSQKSGSGHGSTYAATAT